MKLPKAWWKVPRPIRSGVCEVAWITMEDLIAGALKALAAPITGTFSAYHEWQFGRVNVGLKMRHDHDGKSIEIVGRAPSEDSPRG